MNISIGENYDQAVQLLQKDFDKITEEMSQLAFKKKKLEACILSLTTLSDGGPLGDGRSTKEKSSEFCENIIKAFNNLGACSPKDIMSYFVTSCGEEEGKPLYAKIAAFLRSRDDFYSLERGKWGLKEHHDVYMKGVAERAEHYDSFRRSNSPEKQLAT